MEFGFEVLALLALAALVAGTIDALAGGGGLITIPALMAAGIPPVQAIATNKLQSSFGTTSAVLAFARQGRIDFRRFLWPAVGAFAGSVGGAIAIQLMDPSFLAGLVPVLLVAMAACTRNTVITVESVTETGNSRFIGFLVRKPRR